MLPYPHPDGAIAFRRAEGGEFIIRQDDRGRWRAYFRVTVLGWHFAYGDQISISRYEDMPILLTADEHPLPPSDNPTEMMRAVSSAYDREEVCWRDPPASALDPYS